MLQIGTLRCRWWGADHGITNGLLKTPEHQAGLAYFGNSKVRLSFIVYFDEFSLAALYQDCRNILTGCLPMRNTFPTRTPSGIAVKSSFLKSKTHKSSGRADHPFHQTET